MNEVVGLNKVEKDLLRARLHRLHDAGGGQEGLIVPFSDGEIGEVFFQIRDKDGKVKSRRL